MDLYLVEHKPPRSHTEWVVDASFGKLEKAKALALKESESNRGLVYRIIKRSVVLRLGGTSK